MSRTMTDDARFWAETGADLMFMDADCADCETIRVRTSHVFRRKTKPHTLINESAPRQEAQ